MKHLPRRLVLAVLVGGLLALPAAAQVTPDLVFQTDVTDAYEAYLQAQTEAFLQDIIDGETDAQVQRGQAGRGLTQLALVHVATERMLDDLDDLFGDEADRLDDLYGTYLDPIFAGDPGGYATGLRDLFLGARYAAFKADLRPILDGLDEDLGDGEAVLDAYAEVAEDRLDEAADRLASLLGGGAAFELTFVVEGSDYEDELFVLDRAAVDELDVAVEAAEAAAEALDQAQAVLQELALDGTGDTGEAVDALRRAVAELRVAADQLETLLTVQPLAPLGLDAAVAEALQDGLAEAAAALDGATYGLGAEGTTVRPLALVENLGDGLHELLLGYYRLPAAARPGYTFGQLFPEGLPASARAALDEDAVVNLEAGSAFGLEDEVLRARVEELQAAFEARLAADPDDAVAHVGVALAKTYRLVDDNADAVEDAVDYILAGDFEGLGEAYTWDDFDVEATADSVRDHLERAADADDYVLFTLLVRLEDSDDPYTIGPDDDFVPVYVNGPVIGAVLALSDGSADAGGDIGDALGALFDEADELFELDLDPNVLDVSEAASVVEIIDALQRSNPDFLALTPYGVEQIEEAGARIAEELATYADVATNASDLVADLVVLDDELGFDGAAVAEAAADVAARVREVRDDFLDPAAATVIDGERVDLSAWFDRPPRRILTDARNFFDDNDATDNTFGGLFPDRPVGTERAELPAAFALEAVYPNPFNPRASVVFAVPAAGPVRLRVFDALGREAALLADRRFAAGRHTVPVDAGSWASGVYYVRLEAAGTVLTRPLVVAK